MTSRTVPPVIRALAPAAALILLLTGCGLFRSEEPVSAEPEESASAETEAPDDEGDEENTPAKGRPSKAGALADPGILTAECQPESAWLEFTLYSAEDAQEIANVRFDTADVVHAESDDLSHGRAAETQSVSLETSCDEGAPSLFPERELVLGAFQEKVDGVDASGFGVMAADGTFTALSPEQEDPDALTDYLHPVADPEQDRIVFVADDGEGEGAIQALELESGEITDLGTCDDQQLCESLTIVPGLDSAVVAGGQGTLLAVVLDGSMVVQSTNPGLTFFDIGAQSGDGVVDLTLSFLNRDRSTEVDVDSDGTALAIDGNTLLFDDDVLSVLEFTENTISSYEEGNAGTPRNLWDPLPADRTLFPEGDRKNSKLVVSSDGSEVLFYSEPSTGSASWFKVPADGSSEPEELSGLPVNTSTVVGWQ